MHRLSSRFAPSVTQNVPLIGNELFDIDVPKLPAIGELQHACGALLDPDAFDSDGTDTSLDTLFHDMRVQIFCSRGGGNDFCEQLRDPMRWFKADLSRADADTLWNVMVQPHLSIETLRETIAPRLMVMHLSLQTLLCGTQHPNAVHWKSPRDAPRCHSDAVWAVSKDAEALCGVDPSFQGLDFACHLFFRTCAIAPGETRTVTRNPDMPCVAMCAWQTNAARTACRGLPPGATLTVCLDPAPPGHTQLTLPVDGVRMHALYMTGTSESQMGMASHEVSHTLPDTAHAADSSREHAWAPRAPVRDTYCKLHQWRRDLTVKIDTDVEEGWTVRVAAVYAADLNVHYGLVSQVNDPSIF